MSTRSIIGLAVAIPIFIVVFLVLNPGPEGGTSVQVGSRKAEAACTKPAPDCLPADVSFMDTMNEVHPAESLKGKVVVVNFWATWCKPCKKEIPAFNRVYEAYKDKGVAMFGVLQEDVEPGALLNFASDHEMTYPIVYLDDKIARSFGVPGNIPTTYIYGKNGERRTNNVGALSEADLRGILDALLAE